MVWNCQFREKYKKEKSDKSENDPGIRMVSGYCNRGCAVPGVQEKWVCIEYLYSIQICAGFSSISHIYIYLMVNLYWISKISQKFAKKREYIYLFLFQISVCAPYAP